MINAFSSRLKPISSTRLTPSGLNGRMAKAGSHAISCDDVFTSAASSTSVDLRTYAVQRKAIASSFHDVTTTGMASKSSCRISASRDGKTVRPLRFSHTSIDQPFRNGVTSPHGSTTGSVLQSTEPTAVQLR